MEGYIDNHLVSIFCFFLFDVIGWILIDVQSPYSSLQSNVLKKEEIKLLWQHQWVLSKVFYWLFSPLAWTSCDIVIYFLQVVHTDTIIYLLGRTHIFWHIFPNIPYFWLVNKSNEKTKANSPSDYTTKQETYTHPHLSTSHTYCLGHTVFHSFNILPLSQNNPFIKGVQGVERKICVPWGPSSHAILMVFFHRVIPLFLYIEYKSSGAERGDLSSVAEGSVIPHTHIQTHWLLHPRNVQTKMCTLNVWLINTQNPTVQWNIGYWYIYSAQRQAHTHSTKQAA